MPDTLTETESAVQTATEAHEEAEARLQDQRERVDALEGDVARLEEEHRAAVEAGDQEAAAEAREAKRAARREADALADELSILEDVVERRRQAVEAAEEERALARSEVLLEEARERGTELHALLEDVVERFEEIKALESTHQRAKSTLRRTGYDGPGPGFVKEAAGVHNLSAVLKGIPRALKRDRARRG